MLQLFQMTHMLLPQMLERKRGAIINICSGVTCAPPIPLSTGYTATMVTLWYLHVRCMQREPSSAYAVHPALPLHLTLLLLPHSSLSSPPLLPCPIFPCPPSSPAPLFTCPSAPAFLFPIFPASSSPHPFLHLPFLLLPSSLPRHLPPSSSSPPPPPPPPPPPLFTYPPSSPAYTLQAYVSNFSQSLHYENRHRGIIVQVCPGNGDLLHEPASATLNSSDTTVQLF